MNLPKYCLGCSGILAINFFFSPPYISSMRTG